MSTGMAQTCLLSVCVALEQLASKGTVYEKLPSDRDPKLLPSRTKITTAISKAFVCCATGIAQV